MTPSTVWFLLDRLRGWIAALSRAVVLQLRLPAPELTLIPVGILWQYESWLTSHRNLPIPRGMYKLQKDTAPWSLHWKRAFLVVSPSLLCCGSCSQVLSCRAWLLVQRCCSSLAGLCVCGGALPFWEMVCKTAQEVTKNELFANTFRGPKESSAGLLRVLAGCPSAMSWFWWVGRSRKGCVGWIGMSKARVTVLDRLSVVNVKRMTVLWLGGEGRYSFCDFWGTILKALAEPTLTSVWWLPLMLLSRSLRASVKMTERPFHGIYTNSFAAELACHIGNLEFCSCWEMQTCISSISILCKMDCWAS